MIRSHLSCCAYNFYHLPVEQNSPYEVVAARPVLPPRMKVLDLQNAEHAEDSSSPCRLENDDGVYATLENHVVRSDKGSMLSPPYYEMQASKLPIYLSQSYGTVYDTIASSNAFDPHVSGTNECEEENPQCLQAKFDSLGIKAKEDAATLEIAEGDLKTSDAREYIPTDEPLAAASLHQTKLASQEHDTVHRDQQWEEAMDSYGYLMPQIQTDTDSVVNEPTNEQRCNSDQVQ